MGRMERFLTQISDEQVEWFDLIGDIAYQKRNLVFSPFSALKKKPFSRRKWGQNSNFRKFQKGHL